MDNIPRIGDKIINHKSVKTDANTLENVVESQHSNEPSLVSGEGAESAVRTDKEEYSLKQFRNDYKRILRREVLPKLEPFDKKRKNTNSNINKIMALTLILIIVVGFVIPDASPQERVLFIAQIFIFWFLIGASVKYSRKKSLETEIKNSFMPLLMKAIPGFSWSLNASITKTEIEQAALFPMNAARFSTDDNFRGVYRNIGVDITETFYSYDESAGKDTHTVTIFQGAIARISMNKNFTGKTVIRPEKSCSLIGKFKKSLKDILHKPLFENPNNKKVQPKLEEVVLEDVSFHKHFKVYSTDQIEARYLITTSFIDRFKAIMKAFNTDQIFCSFYENYIYIAPHYDKDLFSLAHLSRTLIDEEQYDVLFREFASILALVDHFKLDKKLGL